MVKCMPYQEEKITEIKLSLKDTELQKLLTFQDKQQMDSLVKYFQHKNPTYRYAAARAFGSFKTELAVDSLIALLKREELTAVKSMAAFALGQIGEERAGPALVEAFQSQDSLAMNSELSRTILEAVGKCGQEAYLPQLASVKSYLRGDTLLLEGQAWSIYRFATRRGREVVDETGTQRMVDVLSEKGYPQSVKFVAAHYLSRARNILLDTFTNDLIRIAGQEESPDLKMAIAIALGKTKNATAKSKLLTWFSQEEDYRVKCNIIRALGNFDYAVTKDTLFKSIKSSQYALAIATADYFLNHGEKSDGPLYRFWARDTTLHWEVQTKLLAAANRHTSPFMESTIGGINLTLRRMIENADTDYKKAAAYRAMGEFPWNYRYIYDQSFIAESPVVRTAGVQALSNIAKRPDFDKYFGLSRRRVKKDLCSYFQEAIQKNDVGMMAVAAGVLRLPNLGFKELVDSTTLLTQALNKLQLPRDIETYNELRKTIDFLEDKPISEDKKTEFNHPIDWRMVSTVTDKTTAIIETNRGEIVIRMMPDIAPGTVANFVMLARRGFYDGKSIHRVVPNFVIQGGCPRGDGYGSEDYSIRSELPPIYYNREGLVGMASAGNHTECTQWFITHSPTPHLDGNYTIFAEVEKGMENVHQTAVGDIIKRVSIK